MQGTGLEITHTIDACRAALAPSRRAGKTQALVPTMGYLHEGHMALVRRARQVADIVSVSIFVNPTQFSDPRDLDLYPRDEERDLAMLREAGVDVVLLPSVADMYPENDETIVEASRLGNILHGAVRPGHFRGVATVVTRLFNIFQPDFACFGEKDYQQLQVIRRMVRDLKFPIEIMPVPTVREPDGLAMSSRNARLTPEDRAAAVVISKALNEAEAEAAKGAPVEALRRIIEATIAGEPRAQLRGLDIVSAGDLSEISGSVDSPVAIMVSAEFGGILLIDQREIFL